VAILQKKTTVNTMQYFLTGHVLYMEKNRIEICCLFLTKGVLFYCKTRDSSIPI